MPPLVIEYVFEGHQRGYNFTSPTSGYGDDELKAIWRNAMPRGQGWGQYVGARSLKCFPVNRAMAVCETEVTDLRDEHGRGGIRRSVIQVMSRPDYMDYLEQVLHQLPASIQGEIEHLPSFRQRMAITNKTMRRPRRDGQLVFLHPYTAFEDWQVVEGLLIKLVLSPVASMQRWGKQVGFTTLALTHRDESMLVAMPSRQGRLLDNRTTVMRV